MHSVEAATAAVAERVSRLATEMVPIREAHGRIVATDLIAPRSLPGFDNSAMDGYAVRSSELPGVFPICAVVGAGQVMETPVPERSCVRIFTGAPISYARDHATSVADLGVRELLSVGARENDRECGACEPRAEEHGDAGRASLWRLEADHVRC